ncbi:MAG: DUF3054 family protein [candidate division WOR-3 bacterium]|nr:DUF3054 family protein [candidate division WOR-3 bacterium]MDW8150262.1 DUF3054 family protein [candidate division WOR-3 bacterium]
MLLEKSLEIIAILITIVLGFISHKRNIFSLEFLLNFLAFSSAWLLTSYILKANFKNLFIVSLYSTLLGSLVRAILLKSGEIPIVFILVFYGFQTIMLYIFRIALVFLK